MRCAQCGTENSPDSRFCGGCGARSTQSAVAPTQKISDEVKWTDSRPAVAAPSTSPKNPVYQSIPPQMPAPAPAYQSIPPQMPPSAPQQQPRAAVTPIPPAPSGPVGVGSSPPVGTGPVQPIAQYSRPQGTPTGGATPIAPITPRASGPQAQAGSSLDESLPRPAPSKLPMILLLVVDLGLAGAGAWMLVQGLA